MSTLLLLSSSTTRRRIVQSMKYYPSLLVSCSSVAFWRTASAFVPIAATSSGINQAAVVAATNTNTGRAFSTTTTLFSKMDKSFPTWSFDKPCQSMEWTDMLTTKLTVASADTFEAGDLVLVGVYAPAKNDDDESNDDDKKKEEEEEEEEEPVIALSGMAAELDKRLGGALTEVMTDNHKAFKHGATAGSTTPTVRIVVDGKVRFLILNETFGVLKLF